MQRPCAYPYFSAMSFVAKLVEPVRVAPYDLAGAVRALRIDDDDLGRPARDGREGLFYGRRRCCR